MAVLSTLPSFLIETAEQQAVRARASPARGLPVAGDFLDRC